MALRLPDPKHPLSNREERRAAQGGDLYWPNSPEIPLTLGKAPGKKHRSCWRMTERILGAECTVQTLDSRVNFRSLA